MANYWKYFSLRATPQSQPIQGTVKNSAGGYAFPVDDWTRLDRFLILGSEGGSYYATARKLTIENAESVIRCLQADGQRTVARIVEVSEAGRAPKNDPAIFALALAASASEDATRSAAMTAIPKVCRTGTHLFQFVEAVEAHRGWGRALRRGVAGWYTARSVEHLALQVVKYRQRGGWSHRDILRLAHPLTDEMTRRAVFDWVCRGTGNEALPPLVHAFEAAAKAETAEAIAGLIAEHNLPREAIPTEWLNEPRVWEALLARMPMTALVRNLGKLSAVGVLKPLGEHVAQVTSALGDVERIRKARVHPLALLLALKTYAQGHGDKGALTWTPVPQVIDALNAAFYTAFANVEATGRRILLALDVSGSMALGRIAGTSLTPREASAAMALMTAATEEHTHIVGFTSKSSGRYEPALAPLAITPSMRLDQAVSAVSSLPFGGTDCALPMLYALEKGISADAFVVYTDSETWAGKIHPVQALRQYREKTGIAAKLVVVGMVSNGFSIAAPTDAGMLDVVGFDAAAPAVIADFIRG
ncbi:MAG: TROVE domain-containing protein [Alphaproteobacteria bacterium]